MIKNRNSSHFFGLFAIAMTMMLGAAQAFGQETIFDLSWTIGEAEVDVPHAPFTFRIGENQAMVTGAAALDFERLGTGGFAFRAPAVLANLNEERQLLDNIYIQYFDVGYISMDDWSQAPRPHVLAASLTAQLRRGAVGKSGGASFRFVKWRDTPSLNIDTATIYYAYEITQANGTRWVNAKAVQLTRRGYAVVTWIGTPAIFTSAADSLEGVVNSLNLGHGAAYADYDKIIDDPSVAGAAVLLDQLHSGQNVTPEVSSISQFFSWLNGTKKALWLLLIPAAAGLIWAVRRNAKKRRARQKETTGDPDDLGADHGRASDPKTSWFRLSLWLTSLVVSLIVAVLFLLVLIETRAGDPFPEKENLESVEGIAWKIDNETTSVSITLMGTERVFRYRRIHGGQVNAVLKAANQSYTAGSRIALYYDPLDVDGDLDEPIDVLAVDVGDTAIVSLGMSEKGDPAAQDRVAIMSVSLIVVFIAAFVAFYVVFFHRLSRRYPNNKLQLVLHGVVALPTLLVFGLLAARLYDAEQHGWVDKQIERAQLALDAEKPQKAIDIAEAVFERASPTDQQRIELMQRKADGLQAVGYRLEDDGILLQSVEAYGAILQDQPKTPKALSDLGYSLIYLGAYNEAFRAFERMGDEGSAYWSLIRRALVHRTLGRHDEASQLYTKAYDLNGNWDGMPLNYHRAKSLILQGRHADAVAAIDMGLEYQEDYAWAFVYRGCAKVNMGDYEGAAADYRSAMDLIWSYQKKDGVPLDYESLYPEQKTVAEIVDAFSRGAIGIDKPIEKGVEFCDQHTPWDERKRDRSPLLPSSFTPPYLMSELELKADEGDAEAMFELGIHFASLDDDFYATPDLIRHWFKRSADAGNAGAMNELGLMYQDGTYDTEIDYAQSSSLFRRGADSGDELAQYNLSQAYRDGLGVEPDVAEAARLMILSAEKGYNAAQYEAAIQLSLGRGIAKDEARADALFAKAADADFRAAEYLRGEFGGEGLFTGWRVGSLFDQYLDTLNSDLGASNDQIWHEQVYGLAQVVGKREDLLAMLNETQTLHLLLPDFKDEATAMTPGSLYKEAATARFKLLRVAAEHGSYVAQVDIAGAYEVGKGTKIDLEAAKFWHEVAAQQ